MSTNASFFCEMIFNVFFTSPDLEITLELLTEIDKLIQLIESPIFTCK